MISVSARAQDSESFPSVSVAVPTEIQNDFTYRSENGDAERNELFAKIEPEALIRLTPELSIFAHGVLEPVRDPGPGADRAFEDHGFFIEDMFVQYERGWFKLVGGKFTPKFGIAWDAAPGIYGSDVAEDNYEFTERIGVAGAVTFGNEEFGQHALSASTFFLDTSFLYQSLGRGRSPVTRGKSDGGISNTNDFSSYAMALDGGEFMALPGFRYHLGYVHLERGEGDTADQRGVAAAVEYGVDLGNGWSFTPLFEYVAFSNAEGVDDQDRRLLTTAGQVMWNNWNLAVSYTGRWTDLTGGGDSEDTHFQVSAGYTFDFGLSLDVGWLIDETDDIETRTFGALAAYTLEF